jgi:hypothetical protein
MATNKQIKGRNKPKQRGRQPKPAIGDYNSIVESIQHVQDKFNTSTAKDLNNYYEMLRQLAHAEGDFSKAGIKDRVMAIKWHIEKAEEFLNDHYQVEEEEGFGEESDNDSSQGSSSTKKDGTTGLSLIQYDCD